MLRELQDKLFQHADIFLCLAREVHNSYQLALPQRKGSSDLKSFFAGIYHNECLIAFFHVDSRIEKVGTEYFNFHYQQYNFSYVSLKKIFLSEENTLNLL